MNGRLVGQRSKGDCPVYIINPIQTIAKDSLTLGGFIHNDIELLAGTFPARSFNDKNGGEPPHLIQLSQHLWKEIVGHFFYWM